MGAIPDAIGPYRPLSILGSGGMGIVYRAEHAETGEVVALKTVLTTAAVERARIRDEIQALRSIEHPGVVRIRAEGLLAGTPWYAMELLDGETLAAWIRRLWEPYRPSRRLATPGRTSSPSVPRADGSLGTTLDPDVAVTAAAAPAAAPRPQSSRAAERPPAAAGKLPEALALVERLCAPLSFIHGEGLVHRDLKPANVIVLPDGSPVLMDFGVVSRAQGMVGREALEAAGQLVGTAPYLAPEQARGQRVDARADLYALGCTLYEMVTGQPPFRGATLAQILQEQLTTAPRPPSAIVSGVPPALDALILGLLAKERRARIGYADDVAAVLAGLGASGPAPSKAARSYLYRPETVGRAAILAELRLHLDAAVAGRGSFVVVGGESGIGKTVVLAELAREAVARRVQVVIGECVAVGLSRRSELDAAGEQLGPLRPLLRAVAGASIEGGPAVAARLLGARGRLLAPYEPAITAVTGPDDHAVPPGRPPELPPEAARERLLLALRDTLVAFSEEAPVLLVVDDLQWADELSRSFLGALEAEVLAGRRLLVVVAYRSEEASEALQAVVGAPHVRGLAIERLDEDGIATLVGHMLAMASPPAAFVRFLTRHSEGNPFFVAEYLRAAVVEGHLRRRDGAWNLRDGPDGAITAYEALPLPLTLRDLVRVRLDALAGPERELAELGCVIGRELDGALLAAASGRPASEVGALLRALRARHVLEPMDEGRHRFTHDKVREVAYAELTPARRRSLHLAAGRAIEASCAADEARWARSAEIGHHFQHAGEVLRAIDHLEKAGELALGMLAHQEAMAHFASVIAIEAGLSARAPTLRRARWDTQIAEAEHALGRPSLGRVHAARAAALLGLPVPGTPALVALDALFEVASQAAHRAFPGRFVPSVARADEALQEAARTYHLLMKCSFLGASPLVILHATLRCLNLAERAGPSPTLANAYAASSCTAAMLSLDALSRAYSRHAHATLDRAEDGPARSFALAMDALSHLARAEWDEMIAAAEAGTVIGSRLGFGRRVDEIQTTLAWAELVRGDLAAAEARYHAMRARPRRAGTQADLWIRVGLAAVHVERDRLDEATAEIRGARAGEDGAQPTELLGLRTLRAVVDLRRGDHEAARRGAEEALAMMKEGPPPGIVSLPSLERVAAIFVALWARARPDPVLREASRSACAALQKGARLLPIWRPAALLAAGHHASCEGRQARARSSWEACASLARELSMPHHSALAELALGQHGPEPQRRGHLAGALATFTRLGATYHAEVAAAASSAGSPRA